MRVPRGRHWKQAHFSSLRSVKEKGEGRQVLPLEAMLPELPLIHVEREVVRLHFRTDAVESLVDVVGELQ